MGFFAELKRRNVFRVGIAYVLMGWVLLQGADFVLDLIGAPDWVIRALAVAVVIGLPIAAVFAWAFELTPEGIKRDAEVDHDASVTPQTGRRLDRLIIIFLGLVVAWFLFDEFYLEPRETAAATAVAVEEAEAGDSAGNYVTITKSIAVLPFADLSQNRDQDWFAEGLAEEILNALARAPDLLVASRTASFAFRGGDTPLAEVGQALGVDHILEGSVRRAGDRIRVTAQLIRAQDGYHVWSQNYDRNASDIIAIQEDLAIAIARALETTMDPEALEAMLSAGTRSVEAFEHYLNGLSLETRGFDQNDFQAREDAYEEFEAARNIDPGFSNAHAKAAAYWYRQVSISTRDITRPDLNLEQKMERFRERIQLAISTARLPVERQNHEAFLATAEGRLRDGLRLARSVFEQRPLDSRNFGRLADSAVLLSDQQLLERLVDHAWSLHDQNVDWAQDYLYYEWRIDGRPRNHEVFVDNVMALIQRYPQAGLLYQAHRTLLWVGETELAAGLRPLMNDDQVRSLMLVDARQACAEGRREDAEALLAELEGMQGTLPPADFASSRWHIEMMLGNPQRAAEALRPFESAAAPMAVTNFLLYPQFDPTSFPVVMSIIRRENIERAPPVLPAFQCPPAGSGRPTVAVLPFRAMSSGPDDGYFADGLTEEILNALTQVPGLAVTSRTSSFYFKDKDLPITDIAGQLGVDHVVEGSVRRSGDRLRVTAQLIRAADDTHLWSETYDRDDADAIAVQEDIATSIAETLGVYLDDDTQERMRRAGLGDAGAFINYQKGRALHEQAHGDVNMLALLEEGNEYLAAALAVQPNFTPAWLFYSDYYTHLLLDNANGALEKGLPEEAIAQAYEEGRDAFTRAARSAPDPDNRAAAELDLAIYAGDAPAWRPLFEEVLDSQACNNVIWHQLIGFTPEYAERFGEQLARYRDCDPMTNRYTAMRLGTALWAGDSGEVLELERQEKNIFDAFDVEWSIRALVALERLDEASTMATIDTQDQRSRLHMQTLVSAAQGKSEEARQLDTAITASGDDNRLYAAQRAAWLGDRERANELAAAIDAQPLGHLSLMMVTFWCACGMPFDLEAAPNFAETWAAADLPWPLDSPINLPLKDW